MAIIRTVSSPQELARSAALHIMGLATEAVDANGQCSIALSGGSTPIPTYHMLTESPFRDRIPWDKVHIFWSDERTVPPDDEDSNFHAAYQSFIEPLSLPESNIHRIKGEIDPPQAAEEYEREIRQVLGGNPPRFDLILLGMGADGHTASLFPKSQAVLTPKDTQLVAANYVEKLKSWRITFTPRLINAASQVTFLISGKGKSQRVYQVLAGRHQPEKLPAQLIKPEDGRLTWVLDQEAAQYLHSG